MACKHRVLAMLGAATIAALNLEASANINSHKDDNYRTAVKTRDDSLYSRITSVQAVYRRIAADEFREISRPKEALSEICIAQFDNFLDGGDEPFNQWNDYEPFGDFSDY